MSSYSLANLVAFYVGYVGYARDLRRGFSKSLGFIVDHDRESGIGQR